MQWMAMAYSPERIERSKFKVWAVVLLITMGETMRTVSAPMAKTSNRSWKLDELQ